MRPSREFPDEQQIFRPITRKEGSVSSDLQNDLKEMKETVDNDFKTIRKEVDEIWTHLQNAYEETDALGNKLYSSFERLKEMFFETRPRYYFEEMDMPVYAYHRNIERLEHLKKEREREEPTIADHLKTIRRELEDLGKKTKRNTRDLSREMTCLKEFARDQHLSLKYKNDSLDKNFLELEELIQRCCTIKKIPLLS